MARICRAFSRIRRCPTSLFFVISGSRISIARSASRRAPGRSSNLRRHALIMSSARASDTCAWMSAGSLFIRASRIATLRSNSVDRFVSHATVRQHRGQVREIDRHVELRAPIRRMRRQRPLVDLHRPPVMRLRQVELLLSAVPAADVFVDERDVALSIDVIRLLGEERVEDPARGLPGRQRFRLRAQAKRHREVRRCEQTAGVVVARRGGDECFRLRERGASGREREFFVTADRLRYRRSGYGASRSRSRPRDLKPGASRIGSSSDSARRALVSAPSRSPRLVRAGSP